MQDKVKEFRIPLNKITYFNFIEFLVVFSIFTILLSLLSPSLKKFQDAALNNACKNNIKTLTYSMKIYAEDSDAIFPESRHTYSFDARHRWNFSAAGYGLLYENHLTESIDSFYCPLYDTKNSRYIGHSMDVSPGVNPWGMGLSYWNTLSLKRVIVGYQYRGAAFQNQYDKPYGLHQAESKSILNSDILDPRFGIEYGHETGYNFGLIDGSVIWFEDIKSGYVEGLIGTAFDGYGTAIRDNRFYSTFREQQIQ